MKFTVTAEVCDGSGPFDAAHLFGQSGELGPSTPEAIGYELTRYLKTLTPDDVRGMMDPTGFFSVRLTATPLLGLQVASQPDTKVVNGITYYRAFVGGRWTWATIPENEP